MGHIQKAPFLQNLTHGALGESFQYLDAKTSGFEKNWCQLCVLVIGFRNRKIECLFELVWLAFLRVHHPKVFPNSPQMITFCKCFMSVLSPKQIFKLSSSLHFNDTILAWTPPSSSRVKLSSKHTLGCSTHGLHSLH